MNARIEIVAVAPVNHVTAGPDARRTLRYGHVTVAVAVEVEVPKRVRVDLRIAVVAIGVRCDEARWLLARVACDVRRSELITILIRVPGRRGAVGNLAVAAA